MSERKLPEWADEWGPTGVKCCGKRTVLCAAWGRTQTVCQVSGWSIELCAAKAAEKEDRD